MKLWNLAWMVVLIWVINNVFDWTRHVLKETNLNVRKRCLVTFLTKILHSHLSFSLQNPDCNQTSFTSWCQTHGNDDGDGDDDDDDGDDGNDSGQAGVCIEQVINWSNCWTRQLLAFQWVGHSWWWWWWWLSLIIIWLSL